MALTINQILHEKKQQILSRWQSSAFSCQNHDLLRGQKQEQRFSNPIAYVIEKNTREIYEWLIKDEKDGDLFTPLEEICRFRAVQDIKPAEALRFIYALKQIIRDELMDEIQNSDVKAQLWDVDQRIDEIGLLAFNIFSDYRAKIYEIRIDEIKRMYGRDAG